MRKTRVLLVLLLLTGALLCGCGRTASKESEYDTAYPLGAAEYRMSVNHKLAPLISRPQPLAHPEIVTREEAGEALSEIEDVYRGISGLNPPHDKIIRRSFSPTCRLP